MEASTSCKALGVIQLLVVSIHGLYALHAASLVMSKGNILLAFDPTLVVGFCSHPEYFSQMKTPSSLSMPVPLCLKFNAETLRSCRLCEEQLCPGSNSLHVGLGHDCLPCGLQQSRADAAWHGHPQMGNRLHAVQLPWHLWQQHHLCCTGVTQNLCITAS